MVNSIKGKIIKAECFFWPGNSHPLTQLYYRWYFCLTASNRAMCFITHEQVMNGFLQNFPIESSVPEEDRFVQSTATSTK